jgi:hypothetical protein
MPENTPDFAGFNPGYDFSFRGAREGNRILVISLEGCGMVQVLSMFWRSRSFLAPVFEER